MKTHKKRMLPIVQVIIIVLGLFGGYYYFMSQAGVPKSAPVQADNWKIYSNKTYGYEVNYPVDSIEHATVSEAGLLNPNRKIQKEKFTVTKSFTQGTNLSSDSGLIIEVYDTPYLCQADYVPAGFEAAQRVTIKDVKYEVATSEGVGAGNLYQQRMYKTLQNNKCFALLINTHSTNIGNYEPGTVREFNKDVFEGITSKMLDTFKVNVIN
jgi:hypothetical protein